MTSHARSRYALAAVLLGLWALPALAADDGPVLQWKFKPGQTWHYVTSIDMKAQQKRGAGQPLEMNSTQTTDMTWTIDSVDDDGNAHITQTITRVRGKESVAGKETTFDSDKNKPAEGAEDDPAEPWRFLVDQPMRLAIDPQGKVLDLRLSDKLVQKLKRTEAAAVFSPEKLKQVAAGEIPEFPKEPVTRGVTWQQQLTMSDPMSGQQNIVTTYRYDGSEERGGQKLDKISATAKISPAGNQPPSLRVSLKDQKSNGAIWFDRAAGLVREMEMTNKVVREVGPKVEETLVTKMHRRLAAEADEVR